MTAELVPLWQAAEAIGVHIKTVLRLIQAGALRGRKEDDGEYFIESGSLDRYLVTRRSIRATS